MNVVDLARPEIRTLKPYSSARMEVSAASTLLNANESPWPQPDDPLGLNRYPDREPSALGKRLADLYQVDPDQILIGRGSDEGIDLLIRAFCRPGIDAIAIAPPTFGMYAVCAGVQGARVEAIPVNDDFTIDPTAIAARLTPAVKVVFLCSPSNPTGQLISLAAIGELASVLAQRAIVVVDEAYVEFAGRDSAATLLVEHANLVVLRTLSKAWGLAGARIGALLGSPDVIALLQRIMPPYPVPTPCVAAALKALTSEGYETTRRRIRLIIAERDFLATSLERLPIVRRVYRSWANFLTVQFTAATTVYGALLRDGIAVRNVSNQPGLADCLRITVGAADENRRLLLALEQATEAL